MTQQIGEAAAADPPPHPHPPRWLSDLIIAVVIVIAPVLPAPVEEFHPSSAAGWVFSLLPVVVVPWRRRWPIPVLLILLLVFGAASFTGMLSLGGGIAVAVAMFNVTFQGPRRRSFLTAACVVPMIVLLSLPATVGSVFDPRVLQFGLIVAFAAAAGDGARSRRAYVAAIMERAERAEQTREAEAHRRVSEERLRIARDLHDTVAHQIAVINLNAGVATSAVDTRPEKAKEALATIRSAARTVLGEIGDLLAVLRSDDEPATTPQPGVGQVDDLIDSFRAVGLDVSERTEGDLVAVSDASGRVAYRVLQEGLTNAHKHGVEHRAHLLIVVDEEDLLIVITNPAPARSTDGDLTAVASGFGLMGLRERVAAARGTIDAGPTPGGWRVAVRLPLSKESNT